MEVLVDLVCSRYAGTTLQGECLMCCAQKIALKQKRPLIQRPLWAVRWRWLLEVSMHRVDDL